MSFKPLSRQLLAAILLTSLACAQPGSETTEGEATAEAVEPLVVYSGRNKSLIGPLLERFETQTGMATEVRYGETAELAATLLEEGDSSPCDVFIAQDAAALGALSQAGRFHTLPEDIAGRLDAGFVSPGGDWVGLSGRARVVVYNTEQTDPSKLPRTLDEVADPRFKGRFGVAPVNGSFQAHMTLVHAVSGHDALVELLAKITANEPRRYPKNSAIVEAVIQGEVEWGLVNHYYLWRALKENPDAPAKNFVMDGDEVSRFLNLAGAGAISERAEALSLLRFLLSDDSQRYFAEETYEYPLVAGVEASPELIPIAQQTAGQPDFARLSEVLAPTLEAITTTGLLE